MRTIGSLVLGAMVLACSSSSQPPASTSSDCVSGTYLATYGAPSGDVDCPTRDPETWTFTHNGDGTESAPAPSAATTDPVSAIDLSACTARLVFLFPASSDPACSKAQHSIAENLTFASGSITGVFFDGSICDTHDGGASTLISCTYTVNASRQ